MKRWVLLSLFLCLACNEIDKASYFRQRAEQAHERFETVNEQFEQARAQEQPYWADRESEELICEAEEWKRWQEESAGNVYGYRLSRPISTCDRWKYSEETKKLRSYWLERIADAWNESSVYWGYAAEEWEEAMMLQELNANYWKEDINELQGEAYHSEREAEEWELEAISRENQMTVRF